MLRRNFLKVSSTAALSVLVSRITYASGQSTMIAHPDEVWAQADNQWFKLQGNGANYSYKDIEVILKPANGALSAFVLSPTMMLNTVKLKWKHELSGGTKVLGDHFERSYGDLGWKAPNAQAKNPWYMLLYDGKDTAGFGVKTGCSTICWWTLNNDSIDLTMDTNCAGQGVKLGIRKLHAADIVTIKSNAGEIPFATYRRFCKIMCPVARLPKQPVYGINDWYFAYGNNSFKLIKESTAMMAELVTDTTNKPFCLVDDGWESFTVTGKEHWDDDFSHPNDKFKDMHLMADEIKKLGMRPGLWMRPLAGSAKDKPSLFLPPIPGRDSLQNPILDPTIAENLERIRRNISIYKAWGYEMVKHDYSTYDIMGKWGIRMLDGLTPAGWHFYDQSKTTAEVINQLYRSIREAAGDMYLIGCNTMSHLSAGVFELNRIGDDTSGREWERTPKMGVNTLAFRIAQHDIFYAADGDCVGLTKDISWARNKQWMQLLAESSAPLFISAQPEALGEEQKRFVKECFAKAAKKQPIGRPLDWLTNPQPAKWELDGREVNFDWR